MIAARQSIRSWDPIVDSIDSLVNSARKIVQSDDLAWDAVQESIRDFWQLESAPPSPRGWLVRATLHRSLAIRRASRRRGFHEERAGWQRTAEDACSDPRERLEQREERDRVRSAMHSLPSKHRVILEKRWIDELDYETIASDLDVPIGTVRSRLSRARDALRHTMSRPVVSCDA